MLAAVHAVGQSGPQLMKISTNLIAANHRLEIAISRRMAKEQRPGYVLDSLELERNKL